MNQFAGFLFIISIFPIGYGKIMMKRYLLKGGKGITSDELKKYHNVYLIGWGIFGIAFLLILLNNSLF